MVVLFAINSDVLSQNLKPRVIVTTDGEEDDHASMKRFLLYTNEWDVEAIVNSNSQFHWVGGQGWNAFHPVEWIREHINLYAKVYPNLVRHDPNYPTPEFLLSKWKVGNISKVDEDSIRTEGARFIADILLDHTDQRPIWIQAWGGCSTLSSALRIIQQDHPLEMQRVADKMRFFLIWEQDKTYQNYIRPNWEPYHIPTIISDQFDCMAYIWSKVLPSDVKRYFQAEWMTENILKDHGPLCSAYINKNGAFNAEGDSPSFLHCIPNGLRSMESPDYGGWGGRYVRVRDNVWMDPLPDSTYQYPTGQWGIANSWSKKMERDTTAVQRAIRTRYFKPIWRWLADVQHDFAARADWCVKDYKSANHPPVVRLNTALDISARAGTNIMLDASASTDPDRNKLIYKWWQYPEAGTYSGTAIGGSSNAKAAITVPLDAGPGETIHMICEVQDSGSPALKRYQRVVITVLP